MCRSEYLADKGEELPPVLEDAGAYVSARLVLDVVKRLRLQVLKERPARWVRVLEGCYGTTALCGASAMANGRTYAAFAPEGKELVIDMVRDTLKSCGLLLTCKLEVIGPFEDSFMQYRSDESSSRIVFVAGAEMKSFLSIFEAVYAVVMASDGILRMGDDDDDEQPSDAERAEVERARLGKVLIDIVSLCASVVTRDMASFVPRKATVGQSAMMAMAERIICGAMVIAADCEAEVDDVACDVVTIATSWCQTLKFGRMYRATSHNAEDGEYNTDAAKESSTPLSSDEFALVGLAERILAHLKKNELTRLSIESALEEQTSQ